MPQYLLAMTIFGTIGLFVRYIELPSALIAFCRGVTGTLFLLLVLWLLKKKLNRQALSDNAKMLAFSGIALGFNWIFLFEAYRLTSIASATLTYYMAPVIVIALSPFILKERVKAFQWLCVAIALLGMSFIAGIWEGSAGTGLKGIVMAFIAACFYAGIVISNKFMKNLGPYDSSIAQLAISALVLIPYLCLTITPSTLHADTMTILLTLTVGVVHTGLAYWLYFSALPTLSASRIAIFAYIDPAIAIVCSVFILKEPISGLGIVGAILILGATFVSEIVGMRQKNR